MIINDRKRKKVDIKPHNFFGQLLDQFSIKFDHGWSRVVWRISWIKLSCFVPGRILLRNSFYLKLVERICLKNFKISVSNPYGMQWDVQNRSRIRTFPQCSATIALGSKYVASVYGHLKKELHYIFAKN